jgi:hypothetical protein
VATSVMWAGQAMLPMQRHDNQAWWQFALVSLGGVLTGKVVVGGRDGPQPSGQGGSMGG